MNDPTLVNEDTVMRAAVAVASRVTDRGLSWDEKVSLALEELYINRWHKPLPTAIVWSAKEVSRKEIRSKRKRQDRYMNGLSLDWLVNTALDENGKQDDYFVAPASDSEQLRNHRNRELWRWLNKRAREAALNHPAIVIVFNYVVIGLRLRDAGQLVGVSESRASQLYNEAIPLLREVIPQSEWLELMA